MIARGLAALLAVGMLPSGVHAQCLMQACYRLRFETISCRPAENPVGAIVAVKPMAVEIESCNPLEEQSIAKLTIEQQESRRKLFEVYRKAAAERTEYFDLGGGSAVCSGYPAGIVQSRHVTQPPCRDSFAVDMKTGARTPNFEAHDRLHRLGSRIDLGTP